MSNPNFTALQCWLKTRRLFYRLWKKQGGDSGLKKCVLLHNLIVAECKRQRVPVKKSDSA